MKFTHSVLVLSASSALALNIPRDAVLDTSEKLYTIETAPGEQSQVTEAQKWELKKKGTNFFDVTDNLDVNTLLVEALAVTYPTSVKHQNSTAPLIARLSKDNLRSTLTTFTTFNNRFYKAQTGADSSAWLLGQINDIITASNATGASAKPFAHTFLQPSIIATIPGLSNSTIVLGGHQDSVNWNAQDQITARAPGADDNGSGSVTILEAFRVLLSDPTIASGQAPNTIEFHWYAAEEAGLLGSQAIFNEYQKQGRIVKAMLAQDMTGYIQGTLNAGKPESFGIIVDYVDAALTEFVKIIANAYTSIPFVESKCGYACSDHGSASKAGYPSAFVFESAFENDNKAIHTAEDTIEKLSFDHMIEHGKLTVGFAYELAFSEL
ncbi:Zn-dependent exopeptidase [Melanomma pulvis-pyrius CBS 109.77]|uniref:Peptide hydrolase n=1 Tax=Melanomma pulvis-pyrius CBS 109.77 TaxID=1314802 RepID=A0A6A6XCL5_9PLEO|nr:Zn-dependent exopeptidase [Melanomma pulvis-pyrius CBS 109.77]